MDPYKSGGSIIIVECSTRYYTHMLKDKASMPHMKVDYL